MNEIENKLKSMIPNMFGENDCSFATHPCDKARAITAINYAFFKNITIERFIALCEQYLYSRGCGDIHTKEQIERIKKAQYNLYNTKATKCWLISIEKSLDIVNFNGQINLTGERIVNFIDYRKSAKAIIDYINFYVSSTSFTVRQKLAYKKSKNKSAPQVSAKLYKSDKGFNFEGLVIFERERAHIVGRRVEILKPEKTEKIETITFNDNTLTNINKITDKYNSFTKPSLVEDKQNSSTGLLDTNL